MDIVNIGDGVWELKMKAPKQMEYKEDKSLGIIKFGEKNDYPQELIEVNSLSGQNNSCLLTYQKFLYGDGFVWSETPFAKEAQTRGINDTLLSKVCYDSPLFDTIALRVHYNGGFKITKVSHWDYSTVRLGLPPEGEYESKYAWISADWRKCKKKEYKPHRVCLYNPATAKADLDAHIADGGTADNWFGQLLIWKKYRAGYPHYVQPRWATALNWAYVDGQTGIFQGNNVDNAFMPSVIFLHPGEPTGITADGRDKKEAIKEDLTKFQGAENAGRIFHLWKSQGSTGEIQVIQFNANNNSELFITVKELCDKQIGKAWAIPNALSNVETPGKLGTSQEITEATQYFQNTQIKPEQNSIIAMFKMLMVHMPNYDPGTTVEIANSTPISFINPAFADDLTKGERRVLLGYPEKAPGEDITELLIERIGVGGSQALISLLQSVGLNEISQEQASNTLQILFGLNKEDADRIVYGSGGQSV